MIPVRGDRCGVPGGTRFFREDHRRITRTPADYPGLYIKMVESASGGKPPNEIASSTSRQPQVLFLVVSSRFAFARYMGNRHTARSDIAAVCLLAVHFAGCCRLRYRAWTGFSPQRGGDERLGR